MIKSMTGFGQAQALICERMVNIEIRSVNNRFKDIVVRTPKSFNSLEKDLEKIIAEKIERGRVDFWLQIDDTKLKQNNLKVDLELAENYLQILNLLKKTANFKEEITLSHLLEFRDIISVEEITLDLDEFTLALKDLVNNALNSLLKMRIQEGQCLALDLKQRLSNLSKTLEFIEAKRSGFLEYYYERLKQRISELTANLELDETRLYQEAAFIAERSDVTEELVRFKSHLKQFEDLLAEKGAVGRKLEFLLQEMGREVNTIGSKAPEGSVIKAVVDLKAELEKMREQVQNVE